jgi:SusD family.
MNPKLIIVLLVFALTGCSKSFLELKNPQSVPLLETINDLASLTTAANGAYVPFKNVDYYNRTFTLLPDLLGDNVFISRLNGGRYLPQDNFAISAGDGYVSGAWTAMYQVIVNATLAIQGGAKLELTPSVYQLLGEMYGIRALAHFDLVRMFAQPYNYTSDASHPGVPIITEVKTEIISPPRATVAEVYRQIIADLEKSLQFMNAPIKQGKFTPAAANALLSKVYLYMGNWQMAEKYATDAINGPYSLLTRSAYVASWNADFSTESLFEVVNTATDNPGSNGIGYLYEQTKYGEALATGDLYAQYAVGDIRRSLIQVGERTSGTNVFESPAYFVKKYPRGASNNSDHIKVLRLSEVYLIRAEARAELGKTDPSKTALAQADLNTIVQRADPSEAGITLSGDALVERILLERRKELAFEGNRFFDLTRRKKDVRHIRSVEERTITYPNDRLIMPIPLREINYNSNIKQNPGWVN